VLAGHAAADAQDNHDQYRLKRENAQIGQFKHASAAHTYPRLPGCVASILMYLNVIDK